MSKPPPATSPRQTTRFSSSAVAGSLGLLAVLGLTACMGTPTPIVPTLEGSIGFPHHGVQTGAAELPLRGPGFERFSAERNTYWARPRLISALEEAARVVRQERPGGAPLFIADLSAKHGGKIPRHNSHRTGRDVDLPWYVTTPAGVPLANRGFVRVGADMLAKTEDGFVRLDIEREWLFVRSLLTSEEIQVQWMFCSRKIEALLVDYARARGEDLALLARAQTVLLQPGDSLAHDDHIHLRIACTPEEAVKGCEGGGPAWTWLSELPMLDEITPTLLEELANDDLPPERTPTEAKEALTVASGAPQG